MTFTYLITTVFPSLKHEHEHLANAIRHEKEIQCMQIKRKKGFFFKEDIDIYVENPVNLNKTRQTTISILQ